MKNFFVKIFSLLLITSIIFAQDDDYIHPELEWRTIETEHFFVHFHDGAERTAKVVAKIAEEIFEPITSLYNHKPDQKVHLVILDYDDYSNGITYFFDNKIEIWASALNFELRGTHNWLRDVVTHEFTHNIQMQTAMKFTRRVPAIYLQWLGYEAERRPDVLYGFPNIIVSYPYAGVNIPPWFAEGTAQFNHPNLTYDYWDTHRDMILRMYALNDKIPSWEELNSFGKTSLGNETVYNIGFSIVDFIAKKFGADKLEKISRLMKSPFYLTFDQAIKKELGIDGKELYFQWKAHIRHKYAEQIKALGEKIEGEIISEIGFGNFHPKFSPDGRKIAYISNKRNDYFSLSSIYLLDLETRKETKIVNGATSFSWSPDGQKIYFSKKTRKNSNWRNLYDIFVYDIASRKEKRLTFGLRANNPAVSSDGKKVAFITYSDGTANIGIIEIENAEKFKLLTHFKNGEQIYSLSFSPDGRKIVFDYSLKDNRDIALIDLETLEILPLISTEADERNPKFSDDGNKIYFSSDRTGIFNIYELNITTGEISQITNVYGGAFMPDVKNEALVYSLYTSSGFKIAMIKEIKPFKPDDRKNFLALKENFESLPANSRPVNYDDTKLPDFEIKDYKPYFTSLSFYPVLRFDNYNKHDRGIDLIRLGFYTYSSEVVGKYSLFAGALFNKKLERDLFLIFEFNDRIPILYQLGLKPKFSIEAYNVTRKTRNEIQLGLNIIPVEITYHLLEVDLNFKWKPFSPANNLSAGFTLSRYSAEIGSFRIPETKLLVPSSDDIYFIGRAFYLSWTIQNIIPKRNSDINPVGRKVSLRFTYELNKLNPDGSYELKDGILVPAYKSFNFPRFELNWSEFIPFLFENHTLALGIRYGTIFGPPVNDFFNFYIGGLTGLRGYSFYSLGGNKVAMFRVSYRFPLSEDKSWQFLNIGVQRIYANLFFETGNAWDSGKPKIKDFKKDIGFEIRIEGSSFYIFPMKIFLSTAYGFDKFEETIGKTKIEYHPEWKFYFGVIFEFSAIE